MRGLVWLFLLQPFCMTESSNSVISKKQVDKFVSKRIIKKNEINKPLMRR